MNSGFSEADSLVRGIKKALRGVGWLNSLESYNSEQLERWRRSMGVNGSLKTAAETNPWIRAHCDKLLACLPGIQGDLAQLASQLGLHLE